jgi:hypothetical protein
MTPHRILQAAINSAITPATRNRLEEITWAPHYVEPGYDSPDPINLVVIKKKGIYFGNWNEVTFYSAESTMRFTYADGNLLPRLMRALEKSGASIEWSDEWTTCDECGGAMRTQPDGHSWTPSYIYTEANSSCLCSECYDDPEDEDASDDES